MEVEKQRRLFRNSLLIAIFIVTVIFLLLLIPLIFIKPVLELEETDVKVLVKNSYEDIRYHAYYLGVDITNQVEKDGNVDTEKIGDYVLSFNIEMGFNQITKSATVHVVDEEAPVINLNGKNKVELCDVGYTEEGYTATDNYDGDITSKVEISKEESQYIYTVSDSSGNTTSVKREFTTCTKKQTTKKTEDFYISLNGSESIYVPLNSEYVEYGALAYDKTDGNIEVSISGAIDNLVPGHYPISYSATNSKGVTITKTRDVYVFDTNTIQNLSGGTAGVIYLTFDDGPSSYTYQILDILDKYGIKATFFVTNSGSDDAIYQEYIKGHTVALHTATHKWTIYSSADSYFADLQSVSDRVYSITGQRTMIIRFPGGSSNTVSRNYKKGIMTYLTSEVLNKGYHYFDWNVCVEDAGACAKKTSYEDKKTCVKSYFKNGLSKNRSNVVLMHDIKKYTMESLEEMIQYAIKEGYTFDKITMDTEQIHMRVNN